MSDQTRAKMNRTLTLTQDERSYYANLLTRLTSPSTLHDILNKTLCQDLEEALPHLPSGFVDLMIIDPPYNLTKAFASVKFKKRSQEEYQAWFRSWFSPLLRLLKPNATVYVCSDWETSGAIYPILDENLIVRNRITWEHEKGRGAKTNWKNASEDIWFCTVGDAYTFNVEQVKLKRRVLAPYRDDEGQPKDWEETSEGDFRLTHPSNLWTDISIPFWSMPENTEHPTQKSEKLVAKLILASSNEGDVIFDPFLGSGTSSVVAKKLNRAYLGIEIDTNYCCLAEKRLALATTDSDIQGYAEGVFWERNSLAQQKRGKKRLPKQLVLPE